MCGLLGFASTENMKGREVRKNFLRTGFPMIALDRGMESSGLALVSKEDANPLIYKKALWGGDYIQQWKTNQWLGDVEKFVVALGHVRASTRGIATDYNAHPFKYGHITLVHNGHIKNASSLPGAEKAQCVVDSAQVAYSMANNGEKETLESVDGGYVFIWWNSKDATLNIARNLMRPLFLAYVEGENSLFWTSEHTQLLHLLRHTTIDDNVGLKFPTEHVWYKYSLKDLRSYEKVPFVPGQGRLIETKRTSIGTGSANGAGNSSTGSADEEWEKWEQFAIDAHNQRMTDSRERKTYFSNRRIGATGATSEVDEIRNQVRNERLKDAKHHGVPTSAKRMVRAKDLLAKMGLKYEQLMFVRPTTWAKYHNQQKLGSMIGTSRTGGHTVEVIGVHFDQMVNYWKVKCVMVDARNVRMGPDNKQRVVGTVSPKMEGFLSKRLESLKNEKEAALESIKDTEETKEQLGSIEREYDGPGGQKVTRARFLDLVTQGCGNCQRQIEPREHGTVVWVGSPPSPVCRDCNKPDIMESLGFPDHLRLVH